MTMPMKVTDRLAPSTATWPVPVSPTTTTSVTCRIVQLRLVSTTGQANARIRRDSSARAGEMRMGRRP